MAAIFAGLWLQLLFIASAYKSCYSHTIQYTRNKRSEDSTNGRLPRSLRPIHYDLQLQPFVDNLTFAGKVKIWFRVESGTNTVTLHSDSLSLLRMKLLSRNNSVPAATILRYTLDPENKFLVLKLDSELQEGSELELHINYTGSISDSKASGIFKVYDKDGQGNVGWLVTSQSEPDTARRIFPCFDEPEWKATFNLSVVRPKALTTVSNMRRIASITRDENWIEDGFETTPRMSSYLLSFVLSTYTYVEDGKTSKAVVRVWTRPEVISQTRYTLLKAPQALNFHGSFFNVPYPLSKLDLLAIPGMDAGGVENWGAINCENSIIQYNEKTASLEYKTRLVRYLIHEISHQWFGNLVTMKWWNDIWLNEGLVSYMEVVVADVLEPTWRLSDIFNVETMMTIMEYDSYNGSNPVHFQNLDPKKLGDVFQYTVYNKAGSLVRMMDYFLSRKVFQKGLSNYLSALQYNCATQDDLWRFLNEAAKNSSVLKDTDVKTVMDTWTNQPGYPLVTVSRDYKKQTATLTQKRFFYDKQMKDTTSRWNIPITLTSAADKNFYKTLPIKWLNITDNELMLNRTDGIPSAESWLILNLQQIGYFRVNYDPTNWNLLIQQLKSNQMQIHAANRAQIISDILSLARTGAVNYTLALSATNYLTKETEYAPWKAALFSFGYLDAMLSSTSLYEKWKTYVQKLIEPAYKAVGFEDKENDPYLKRMARSILVKKACNIDLPNCVVNAQKLFKKWMQSNGNNLITPNLAETVICTGIKHGGEAEWDFAWRQFLSTIDIALRKILVKGLACSGDPSILLRFLNASIHGNNYTFYTPQKKDILSEIGPYNIGGRDLAFDFLNNNWAIYSEMLSEEITMGQIIEKVTYSMNTEAKLQKVKLFIKNRGKSLGVATNPLQMAVDTIGINIRWIKDNLATITQWLNQNA